jgi:hypothetical protein
VPTADEERPHYHGAVADWATISALATGGGTLVLAAATFASVRSGNRTARLAERSLLANIRPLLLPSHLDDPQQKVTFIEGKVVIVPGGAGVAEITDDAVYLALSLRNAGSGVAVLHAWHFYGDWQSVRDDTPEPEELTRLTRDLYIAVGDLGFWQGTFRDPASEEFAAAVKAIQARNPLTVDVMYGDFEGGQRTISRFSMLPRPDDGWLVGVARHWSIDRGDPR